MNLIRQKDWIRALLFLAALSIQAFVIGTHIHGPAGQHQHQQQQQQNDNPEDCLLCQSLASIGQAILPTAPPIAVPVASPLIIVAAALPVGCRECRGHHWLSRGPPAL